MTYIKNTAIEVINFVKSKGIEIRFSSEDSFRSDLVARVRRQLLRGPGAGARRLIVEGRESGQSVGCFDDSGRLMVEHAERLAETFGLKTLIFEAPAKPSQFAFMNHFGPEVQLGNVRLDEVLRVEIYRRGLHSDAFAQANLRPRRPTALNGSG